MDKSLTKPVETTLETPASQTQPSRVVKPRVDIVEHNESIVVYADMPGVSAETLDVTLERNTLLLHGKAPARNKLYQRAFTLSKRIDRDNITATVKDGVLTLALGFSAEVAPIKRQIRVNAA